MRVVDVDQRLLGIEIPNESDGWRLASITSVSLECESEDGNALEDNVSIEWILPVTGLTLPVIVLKRVSTTLFEKRFF